MLSVTLSGAGLDRQERLILLLAVFLTSLLLWAILFHRAAQPGHLHADGSNLLATTFLMWLLMMIAMMLPPVLPWIWFFAATTKKTSEDRVSWLRTWLFSSGYFAVWGGFSLVAAWAQLRLQGLGHYGESGLVLDSPLSAGIILLAGIFQFCPLKRASLDHCRSPLSYFLSRWKEGPAGAFELGCRHGLFCLGCCWALMIIGFAVGTMNLVWMGVIVLMLCGEKIAPAGERLSQVVGVGLILWGGYQLWQAVFGLV